MWTRQLAAVATASWKFSKWTSLKTQNCYNFGIHVNICIKMYVLMASCLRTYHLILVKALKLFKMAATESSKSLHVFHASHIVLLSSEVTGAYHHNVGLHVNICMKFCVLIWTVV